MEPTKPVILGTGEHRYRVVESWAKLRKLDLGRPPKSRGR